MGWLNKIFKGSSHNISHGQYNGKYDNDTVWNEPSDSLENEDEDIDHAIALSLSEVENQKGKEVDDETYLDETHLDETHLDEDEQLARALQESLNAESPRENSRIHELPVFFTSRSRICAGCKLEIGHGRYLSCMGALWHPACFCCHACDKPISDYEFSMYGDHPYHKACYKDRFHPKCDVCRQFIPTNTNGLIEYRAHPFWMQKYCPAHERDSTPRCCSCERMEPRDAQYITLDDGRKLCLECLDSSIMDTHECQPLYIDIREFYEGLNMKVNQQIPLLLVEREALNEAMVGEKKGHHHLPETRGLCLSEEQIVSSIARRPRIRGNRIIDMITEPFRLVRQCEVTAILILYGLPRIRGNRIIDMITEPFRLVRQCEVTAILILYGLPRLLTGSILAHEMMHAWLRLNGYRTLPPEVEEGICQVLAHMWIDSEIIAGSGSNTASSSSSSSSDPPPKKGTRSQFERRLGDFFKHQIESDSSTAYGDGFRAGIKAVEKYGLRTTLEHIRFTASFPL